MPWLLIGYMFLFIHRPFEVWPALGDLRIERIYMAMTVVAWLLSPGKRWLPNAMHAGCFGLMAAVLFAWVLSPWMDRSQPFVEDWFKIVVFFLLLVTSVHDEATLKKIIVGFVCVMGLYLAHSLREFLGGRHVYRMGIVRMIGVDSSLGDPNSFGAGIVYALPFAVCLWRVGIGGRVGKLALSGYIALSALCILLTGSRSSLLGLALWGLILVLGSRRRFLYLALISVAAPVAFLALPPSLQNRFETIVDSDVGPANAKESGEGRIEGFLTGLQLWSENPLAGVGPGAWRPATRSKLESHNLYGQLVGETGTLGLLAFLGVLAGFWVNLRRIAAVKNAYPEWRNDLLVQVGSAVAVGVVLLLFMGNFGHNLFRFSWLWFGGFLMIARHCLEERLEEPEFFLDQDEAEIEQEVDWIAA